jgi:hypothetical protein
MKALVVRKTSELVFGRTSESGLTQDEETLREERFLNGLVDQIAPLAVGATKACIRMLLYRGAGSFEEAFNQKGEDGNERTVPITSLVVGVGVFDPSIQRVHPFQGTVELYLGGPDMPTVLIYGRGTKIDEKAKRIFCNMPIDQNCGMYTIITFL